MYGFKANGTDNIWDETRRMPFLWEDDYLTAWVTSSIQDVINVNAENATLESLNTQMQNPDSLWSVYAGLLKLRNENIALKYGNSFVRWDLSTSSLQGFYREVTYDTYHQKLLILHNFDDEAVDMIEFDGKLIYVSGITDLTEVTSIPAKSTVIIEIAEE